MSAVEWPAAARAAVHEHGIYAFNGSQTACRCDDQWRSNTEHEDHVADAVLAALSDHATPRTDWEWGFVLDQYHTEVYVRSGESSARSGAAIAPERIVVRRPRRWPPAQWEVAPDAH